jgi:TonB family protein
MRIPSAFAALVALGACASGGGARGAPGPLPPLRVSTFIDSAALHQALLSAPPVPSGLPERALFTVSYDSTGTLKEVNAFYHPLLQREWGDTMSALLRRHLAPRLPARKAAFEFLGLASGPSPRIEVLEYRVDARPVIANGEAVARELRSFGQRLRDNKEYKPGERFRATLAVLMDPEGNTMMARVRTGTGKVDVDAAFRRIAEQMRFQPAQFSGYPVPIRATIPFEIIVPEDGPGRGAVP